jgi:hypothetical protein
MNSGKIGIDWRPMVDYKIIRDLSLNLPKTVEAKVKQKAVKPPAQKHFTHLSRYLEAELNHHY